MAAVAADHPAFAFPRIAPTITLIQQLSPLYFQPVDVVAERIGMPAKTVSGWAFHLRSGIVQRTGEGLRLRSNWRAELDSLAERYSAAAALRADTAASPSPGATGTGSRAGASV
jgi:hypothetical protein